MTSFSPILNQDLEPRGGTPRKIRCGCAARFPKPLPYLWPKSAIFPTLFMTWPKIWYPFYDLTLSFCCWLYLACKAGVKRSRGRQSTVGRRQEWWRSSFFQKKPNWRLKCKKQYPIYDPNGGKMAKIDTQFMTKTAEKPYPLGSHIPI